MSAPRRDADVAVSAPALAHQWARQEGAPHGSAVVAHREVAGRLRGGIEWIEPVALAVSVVARPAELPPSMSDVTWLAAGLAAADLEWDQRPGPWWPDCVQPPTDGSSDGPKVAVTAESVLEPGRVGYALLTVRLAGTALDDPSERKRLSEAAVTTLRSWADLLDRPHEIVAAYRPECATLGQVVRVTLSPHGSTRGTAVDITDEAALLLRSPTGLEESVPVTSCRTVQPVDPGAAT